MSFRPASRKNARLRLALSGPSGSGKTLTALLLAKEMGSKIGVLDSERGSSELYSNRVKFDVACLEEHAIQTYLEKIADAAAAGYDVLVIDSYSHSWMGKGGALEAVDQGGGWTRAGKTITPLMQRLVDAILTYPGHVIVTMRSKMEHAIEKDAAGKVQVRKVGMAAQVRDGTEYEFGFVLDLNREGGVEVSKTRCEGRVFHVGESFARADLTTTRVAKLKAWLADGEIETPREALANKIRFAKSDADLQALIPELKTLSDEDRAALLPVYTTRVQELRS